MLRTLCAHRTGVPQLLTCSRWRSRRRKRDVLARRSGLIGNAEQLLSLLLLEDSHLIFKHPALDSTLALVLLSLELDPLQTMTRPFSGACEGRG